MAADMNTAVKNRSRAEIRNRPHPQALHSMHLTNIQRNREHWGEYLRPSEDNVDPTQARISAKEAPCRFVPFIHS